VITTRPVAAFASGLFCRLFSGSDRFEMWILIEIQPDIGMAGPAWSASHEGIGCLGGGIGCLRGSQQWHEETNSRRESDQVHPPVSKQIPCAKL
jgi:hypothetical protein